MCAVCDRATRLCHENETLAPRSDTAIAVRDIWERRHAPMLAKGAKVLRVPQVPSRDSRFFLLTPAAVGHAAE